MLDICDLHGHFLPGMDDGSKSAEESVQMLTAAYGQGVRRMCATPHYYPVESVAAFLQRRQEAVQKLEDRLAQENQSVPQICLGAEVAYRPGIDREEALDKLCLGRSRYLLLEMPFSKWSSEVIRTVRNICSTRGIVPIIAHIERYLSMQSSDMLRKLLEMDVLVQMNAECLLRFQTRGKGRRLLRSGLAQLLGSDCHNMTTRKPNLGPAVEYLRKCGMEDAVEYIAWQSNEIFREAAGE